MTDVHLCEVGPRDGLQNARHLMPTPAKQAWISALAAAGLREIEVGAFVPPKLSKCAQYPHPGVEIEVFVFEAMGVDTGIDLEALFKARALLASAIPEEPIYGHIPLAGLPKGFSQHV